MQGLTQLLTTEFGVADSALDKAATYIQKFGGRIEKVLVSIGALSSDQLPELYYKWLGVEPLNDISELEQELNSEVPFDLAFLTDQGWLPVVYEDNNWVFAVTDPLNAAAIDHLSFKKIPYSLLVCNEDIFQQLKMRIEQVSKESELNYDTETDRLLELATEAPIINLVNNLIFRAIRQGASDMHVETEAEKGRVRYRVDGVLHDADTISRSMVLPAITRLKILSSMDIAERRRPQDGKIEMSVGAENLDIRVSVMPRGDGESVVMRFLRQDALKPQMQELGMAEDIEFSILEDLKKTSGVILLTGPTGSGKTTSLYTFLSHLNTPEVKVITLEDPIEYQLEGINQVQVQPDIGFDFASGLRSIVRQDPDIIMLGEIRDKETASIAMQSALTGHLVFSTVHTNDAPSAFSRLLDLGVDEFLLNAALVSIIAQRLARKLCDHCKVEEPDAKSFIERYQLQALAQKNGLDEINLMTAHGCEHCSHTGYKGRTAIMEYMRCDEDIRILAKDAAFNSHARTVLKERGGRNLMEDGLLKAVRGQTTIAEVIRVAG